MGKFFEAPNKENWDRKEYLEGRKKLSDLTKKPFSPFIFCYNCKKEIKTSIVPVVNFGKDPCCNTCYVKNGWAKIRTRIAKFPIPTEFQDQFYDLGEERSPDDVDKSVDTGGDVKAPEMESGLDAPLKP